MHESEPSKFLTD